MNSMVDLLAKLGSLNLAPVSPDMELAKELLCRELDFKTIRFPSGADLNGWVVPESWHVETAQIRHRGVVVYDGMVSPLGVIGNSESFHGKLSLDELLPHLFVHADRPDDLPYHFAFFTRPETRNWGFGVPQTWRDQLPEGEYEVQLGTIKTHGELMVLEYTLPGDTDEIIIINGHNCHAGQVNDGLSGVVAGIEIINRLSQVNNRRYTYRLIVAPELIGTAHYVADISDVDLQNITFCLFLDTLGNNNRMALQESFDGGTALDDAAELYLRQNEDTYDRYGYRQLIGNDEAIWEGPGIEIPTISLARHPFPEYHSNRDTVDVISEDAMEAAVTAAVEILLTLDRNVTMTRKFTGTVALSNPRFDLYIRPGTDPSMGSTEDKSRKWNYLMNRLPRYFNGVNTALDAAMDHDLPFSEVRAYIRRFEDKGLVHTVPASYSRPSSVLSRKSAADHLEDA